MPRSPKASSDGRRRRDAWSCPRPTWRRVRPDRRPTTSRTSVPRSTSTESPCVVNPFPSAPRHPSDGTWMAAIPMGSPSTDRMTTTRSPRGRRVHAPWPSSSPSPVGRASCSSPTGRGRCPPRPRSTMPSPARTGADWFAASGGSATRSCSPCPQAPMGRTPSRTRTSRSTPPTCGTSPSGCPRPTSRSPASPATMTGTRTGSSCPRPSSDDEGSPTPPPTSRRSRSTRPPTGRQTRAGTSACGPALPVPTRWGQTTASVSETHRSPTTGPPPLSEPGRTPLPRSPTH